MGSTTSHHCSPLHSRTAAGRGLRFPVRQARRASDNLPSCPSTGFAHKELRSWDTVVAYCYYDCNDAVRDTIDYVGEHVFPTLAAGP